MWKNNIIQVWGKLLLQKDFQGLFVEMANFFIHLFVVSLCYWILKKLLRKLYHKDLSSYVIRPVQKIRGRSYRTGRQQTISDITFNGLNYLLDFIYFYLVLSSMGFPMATLVAGAGIASVAFGLAAQNFVKDLINGFFILVENQYEIGDFIEIPQHSIQGLVENAGIRVTTVKAFTGDLYFVPNSAISIVKNMSRQPMLVQIDLPLHGNPDMMCLAEEIKSITADLENEYAEHLTDRAQVIGVIFHEPYQYVYRIAFYVVNGQQYRLKAQFYQRYFTDLQARGFKLLPPTIEHPY